MQDIGAIPNAAILIRNGRIVEVGTSRRIENLAAARNAYEVSAGGRLVMPAFVDPFFAPMGTTRVQSFEASARLRARVAGILGNALCHGTVSFGLRPGYDLPALQQIIILRAFRAARDGPWNLRIACNAHESTSLDGVVSLIRRELASDLQVAPRMADLARQAASSGVPVRLYAPLGESAAAVRLAIELGGAAVESVGELGPLDIRSLALSHTIPVLLPFAGARPEVARGLLESGAVIALGTGFGHHFPGTYSQQAVVESACAHFGFSLEEALTSVTVNAAWALGTAMERGTVEPGKMADLIVLNCEAYPEFTDQCGVNRVALVLKSGTVVNELGGDAWKTGS
jgi:imidazolonepropionase